MSIKNIRERPLYSCCKVKMNNSTTKKNCRSKQKRRESAGYFSLFLFCFCYSQMFFPFCFHCIVSTFYPLTNNNNNNVQNNQPPHHSIIVIIFFLFMFVYNEIFSMSASEMGMYMVCNVLRAEKHLPLLFVSHFEIYTTARLQTGLGWMEISCILFDGCLCVCENENGSFGNFGK